MSVVTCRWCGQLFAGSTDLHWHLRHEHQLDLPTAPATALAPHSRRTAAARRTG